MARRWCITSACLHGEQVAMLEMLARVGPDGFDHMGRLPRRLSKAACCLLHPGHSLRQPGPDPSYAQSAEPEAGPTRDFVRD